MKRCVICTGVIEVRASGWADGHNAEPIAEGRCCDTCNWSVVLGVRLGDIAPPHAIQFAFSPTIGDDGCGIGRADRDVRGYTPVMGVIFKTWSEAYDHADKLNRALGLTNAEAVQIVASSMRG